jgi:hypothetical protein
MGAQKLLQSDSEMDLEGIYSIYKSWASSSPLPKAG